ncbi:MAG: DUF4956 domain-containing protein [Spirochaetaceae bacterium]
MDVLLLRFLINAVVIVILTWGIYYKINRNSEYLFNFIIFNILIFFVSSLLSKSDLNTGFAFGIFAIFSILRYRTEPLPIKEMTYMFISIVVAIINSTVTSGLSIYEIAFANIIIVLATYIMEKKWLRNYKAYKRIIFEDIKLIHKDKKTELIEVLESRTGYKINDVFIEKIDYLKDIAVLKVYMG